MLANIGSGNISRNKHQFMNINNNYTFENKNVSFDLKKPNQNTTRGYNYFQTGSNRSPIKSTREERWLNNRNRSNISVANPKEALNYSADLVGKSGSIDRPSDNYGAPDKDYTGRDNTMKR